MQDVYLTSVYPKSDATAIEENQDLGLPLIVSTGRVEPIPSKETVLANSRSEEGSRKPKDLMVKSHKERLFLKNTLLEKRGLKTSRVRVSS